MEIKKFVGIYFYPFTAAISTLCLITISLSLLPIAKWSKTQNDCVERTFRVDGQNSAGIPAKVWSCNGGGE